MGVIIQYRPAYFEGFENKLSGLYFICENKKQEKWMNENPYYKYVPPELWPPKEYFKKN